LVHKNRFEQLGVYYNIQNPGSIRHLLNGTVGAPSCSLLTQARDHRNPSCRTNYRWNLTVPSARDPSRYQVTIFTQSLGSSYLF
jgi:hypothetical protein